MKNVTMTVASLFWVASARAEGAAAPAGGMGGAGLLGIVPWVAIFVIFYFLLIRPQQKQAAEQKKMIDALKRGDRVLTSGGLYGVVNAVKGKILEVKLNDDVKVHLSRSAVTQVVGEDPAREPETAVLVEKK